MLSKLNAKRGIQYLSNKKLNYITSGAKPECVVLKIFAHFHDKKKRVLLKLKGQQTNTAMHVLMIRLV